MSRGALGKVYADGEWIIRQGEVGNCMFVIQEGQVEVVAESDGQESVLAVLDADDCFGEMAVFERAIRSAAVRALGQARVLTIDGRTLLRRFHEDPSLGMNILQTMSRRIRALDDEVVRLKGELRRYESRRTKPADGTPSRAPSRGIEP